MASNWTRNDITYISETEIDGTVAGTTDLTTTQDSTDPFNPMVCVGIIKQEENVLVPCIISVGTNAPNYNNIVQSLTIGSGIGNIIQLSLASTYNQIPPNTLIKVKVNVAAIPVLLTTPISKFKIAIHGFDVLF